MKEFWIGASVVFASVLTVLLAIRYLLRQEGDDIFVRRGILEPAN